MSARKRPEESELPPPPGLSCASASTTGLALSAAMRIAPRTASAGCHAPRGNADYRPTAAAQTLSAPRSSAYREVPEQAHLSSPPPPATGKEPPPQDHNA